MSRTRRTGRGSAAVEFAMTMPVMALLLLGTIEYGWYFTQLAWLNSITREAARYGSAQDPDVAETAASVALVVLMEDSLTQSCAATGCVITTVASDLGDIEVLEVEVAMPYDQLTGVLPNKDALFGFTVPQNLRARVTMPMTAPE